MPVLSPALMPLLKRMTRRFLRRGTVPGRMQAEREMMIMRETDQWMMEHYAAR